MKRILTTLMVLGAFLAKAQSGKVGINTETPKETLQVNGTLQVTLPEKGSENSIYENASATERKGTFTPTKMVVADANGVLGQQDIPALVNVEKDKKPFYYIEYNLTNVQGDWIQSFNTKIPSNKYLVVVVGAELYLNGTGNYFIRTNSTNARDFNPSAVSASVEGGEWILRADYVDASFSSSNSRIPNGSWRIKCLIINTNAVNNLGVVTQDLGGNTASSVSAVTPNDVK